MVAVVEKYDYVFPENGLVAYKDGKLLGKQVGSEYPNFLLLVKHFLKRYLTLSASGEVYLGAEGWGAESSPCIFYILIVEL